MSTSPEKFKQMITEGYHCEHDSITLGAPILDGNVIADAPITIPLKTLNRHGLIAGATGTGKTKTLQLLAELLSRQGIPSLLMDIKGDLSGLAQAGSLNDKIAERQSKIGISYNPQAFPVELLSLSAEQGVALRASVEEFGPLLMAQILELNETQGSVLAVIFKFCSDQKLPLIDLNDLKKVLNFVTNEAKNDFEKDYGLTSTSTAGSILRKILALEQQGVNRFFGEPSFSVNDLLGADNNANARISILRLLDIQDRPQLFGTFMLGLLTEVYRLFPEIGDPLKPKLVIVIDEAHLIFNTTNKALLEKIATIIKLIRSKGVGIFFCTQDPTDIPSTVLSQLGLKIQHALRSFTAKDRKAIKLVAENYPTSEYYDTSTLITSLGMGEALITALDETGKPTPLAMTLLQAPSSRLGPLTDTEIATLVNQSLLVKKYALTIPHHGAEEIINQQSGTLSSSKETKEEASTASALGQISKSPLLKQILNTVVREGIRGIMSALGIRNNRPKR